MISDLEIIINKELNDLKLLFEYPRLYLTNFFDEIKLDVDTTYTSKELNESDNDLRVIIRTNWTRTIDRIIQFETECYKNKVIFNQDLIVQIEQAIEQIECYIDESNKLNSTNTNTTKLDSLIKLIRLLIFQTSNRLEEILFQNKTIFFLAASDKLNRNLAFKVFGQTNVKTNVGKLIIINDNYLSKEMIHAYINNSMSNVKLNHTITNDLLKLGQLKAYDLSSEPIDEIALNLNYLEDLDLTYMIQESIESDVFKGFTNLKRITLCNNKFTKINEQIFQNLTNLTEIKLENNYITHIDKFLFFDLNNLTQLKLNRNKLVEIHPNAFKNLTNLKVLDLTWNQLKSIDSNLFFHLIKLEWISLSFNQFESFDPDLLQQLTNLTTIQLNNNRLKFIDKNFFQNSRKLVRINLANNKLEDLDVDFFTGLEKLKSICLYSNQLKHLNRDIFKDLVSLNHIELHNNPFSCGNIARLYYDLNLESNVEFISFKTFKNDVHLFRTNRNNIANVKGKCFYLTYSQWMYFFKLSAVLLVPIIYKLCKQLH